MATYLTPGVYVEEIPTIPGSVAPLATAVPAFVGYTEKGYPVGWLTTTVTLPPVVKRITSFMEYEAFFGGPYAEIFKAEFTEATGVVVVDLGVIIQPIPPDATIPLSPYRLYHSVRAYFQNGGGPCYILSVGGYKDYDPDPLSNGQFVLQEELSAGIAALERYDEPTLLSIPESTTVSSNYAMVIQEMLMHCYNMKDRFALIDPQTDSILSTAITDFRNAASPGSQNALQYGAAYLPWLNSAYDFPVDGASKVKIIHPPVLTVTPPPTNTTMAALQGSDIKLYRAVLGAIIAKYGKKVLPASPFMAGIYASVDRDRGVWKAPANVAVADAISPTVLITDLEQQDLNVPTDGFGKSINAIRTFTGRGNLVWGARTLAGNDNEWRYVPVRRFFLFAEESIQEALAPMVFEPNTAATWARVKGMIGGFLTNLWRQGALAGTKPEQAFYVNVGLGTTMTAQDILEGRLIVEVGMAAVRPAEFIVLKFQHKMQEA
jgi:uncharacterized protein